MTRVLVRALSCRHYGLSPPPGGIKRVIVPYRVQYGRNQPVAGTGTKNSIPRMEGLVPQKRFLAGGTKQITMELAQMKCITYKAGSPPLIRKEMMDLLGQVPGWSLQAGHLTRTFAFPDAASCIAFITEIAGFSAGEGHFPDICMKEGRFVDVSFYTYPAGGLTLNDFILAAKLNETEKTQ